MASINTVIFDIGNVLMKFGWMNRVIGLYGEETGRKITRAIWEDGVWEDLDLGTADIAVVEARAIAAHPELADKIHEMIEHASEVFFSVEYAIPWVKELKEKGYKVLYLSNYSQFNFDIQPEDTLGFLPYMDGGIFSYKVGLVKPDEAIYRRIVEEYALIPEECLFIDDTLVNVEAAQKFGMHAVRFTGYEETYPEVMRYLESSGAQR